MASERALTRIAIAMETNSQLVNSYGVTDLTVKNITATTGQDLTVANASGKDIIVTFSDAAGARKLIFKDSGTATVASLNSDGLIEATTINATKLNDTDTDAMKIGGLWATRNAADSSMYIPVADSSGYERGIKLCYAPAANAGGYFESVYINTKVAASMAGTVRATENKVSVTGSANMSGEVVAEYCKINVETGATVASAIGLDVAIDPEGSATITTATGVRVNGSTKLKKGIDLSTLTAAAISAVDIPYVDGNAAVNIANLETAFGTDDLKQGIIGQYQDNSDAVWLIIGNAKTGKYQKVACTAVDA